MSTGHAARSATSSSVFARCLALFLTLVLAVGAAGGVAPAVAEEDPPGFWVEPAAEHRVGPRVARVR
jgi:hypothetical protein